MHHLHRHGPKREDVTRPHARELGRFAHLNLLITPSSHFISQHSTDRPTGQTDPFSCSCPNCVTMLSTHKDHLTKSPPPSPPFQLTEKGLSVPLTQLLARLEFFACHSKRRLMRMMNLWKVLSFQLSAPSDSKMK
jgi:hypothetical protein